MIHSHYFSPLSFAVIEINVHDDDTKNRAFVDKDGNFAKFQRKMVLITTVMMLDTMLVKALEK